MVLWISCTFCAVLQNDELRRRHEAVVAQHRREALNVHQRLEEEKMRMRHMYGDVNQMRVSCIKRNLTCYRLSCVGYKGLCDRNVISGLILFTYNHYYYCY